VNYLRSFIEAIDYRITGGCGYQWECFGPNARYLDSDDTEDATSTYHAGAVFDSVTQTVYVIEAWDYLTHREYRWINPEFKLKFEKESISKAIDPTESCDDRKFIDLDVVDDILEKIAKIVRGEPYDTRVKVPVDFTDEELLQYMKLAHERDITFNQLVEEALLHAIEEHEAGRLTKEDAQRFIRERDEDNRSV
jgi:hypothetical protein